MIAPTVGRKVWYSPPPHLGVKLGEQPFDASIVFVHNERLVNLLVVDHIGAVYARTSVALLQDGDAPAPEGDTCQWMPYQKGQAAVTPARIDAIEKSVARVTPDEHGRLGAPRQSVPLLAGWVNRDREAGE